MLKVEGIKKNFGTKQVLKNINIEINAGEVYGLIGANGAGKTTLMNIIAQVLKPDEGRVFVDREEITSANNLANKVGYIIDIPAMFEFMTVSEYLEFLTSPMKLTKQDFVKKVNFVLKAVGLHDVKDRRISTFSRGMKQRMGIAAALISDPKILLMDEPSSALDPQGRFEVVQIINYLKSQGKTIILSTHILNDVERVCDRMGLLVDGSVIIEGNIHELMKNFSENILVVSASEDDYDKIILECEKSEAFAGYKQVGSSLEISYKKGEKNKLFKAILNSKVDVGAIYQKTATIEEIFLKGGKQSV